MRYHPERVWVKEKDEVLLLGYKKERGGSYSFIRINRYDRNMYE